MKPYYLLSAFPLILSFLLHTPSTIATPLPDDTPYCKDAGYSPEPRPNIPVPCPMEDVLQVKRRQNTNSTNMFKVTLNCLDPDKTKCGKVERAFSLAGRILTGSLILNTEVVVNATYTDFCKSFGDCSNSGLLTLGGAAPARTLPLSDTDGQIRFYPQALVKQINSERRPQLAQFDILAMFNSVANFWFQEDNVPIRRDQSDFLFVICHELVHGLGFTSSWDDYINQVPEALTPDVTQTTKQGAGSFQFSEFSFDKHMIIMSTGERLTNYTAKLNEFSFGAGAQIRDVNSFVSAFVRSPQYQVAKDLFKLATTRGSFGFIPQGETDTKKSLLLETSLVPYQQGSSISHVDFQTFSKNSDFLMRFIADTGITLGDAIVRNGNFSGGAIGPQLLKVFESMGYATQQNPNPVRPSTSSGTPQASSSSSTIYSNSLLLVTGILLATVIGQHNIFIPL